MADQDHLLNGQAHRERDPRADIAGRFLKPLPLSSLWPYRAARRRNESTPGSFRKDVRPDLRPVDGKPMTALVSRLSEREKGSECAANDGLAPLWLGGQLSSMIPRTCELSQGFETVVHAQAQNASQVLLLAGRCLDSECCLRRFDLLKG